MHNNDDRCVLAPPGLPVTMPEQTGFRIDLELPGFGGRYIEPPWHKSRHDGHDVAVFQQRVRFEWRDDEMHIETVFQGVDASKTKAASEVCLNMIFRIFTIPVSIFHRTQARTSAILLFINSLRSHLNGI